MLLWSIVLKIRLSSLVQSVQLGTSYSLGSVPIKDQITLLKRSTQVESTDSRSD